MLRNLKNFILMYLLPKLYTPLMYLLPKLYTSKLAMTKKEKEAVYRFRYKIYVQQIHRRYMQLVDHEHQMLFDKYDDTDNNIIVYVGKTKNIIATVTLRCWTIDKLPEEIRKRYGIPQTYNQIPNLKIGEVCYLISKPSKRATLAVPSLIQGLSELMAIKLQPDIMYFACLPGLITYYQKLGCVSYLNELRYAVDGVTAPLVILPYDTELAKKMNSLIKPMTKTYSKSIDRSIEEQTQVLKLLKEDFSKDVPFKVNRKDVDNEIEEAGLNKKNCMLLEYLSLAELKTLCGLTLTIEPQKFIVTKNIEDHEIYIIIAGEFEVLINNVRIKKLSKGDTFGEIAFIMQNYKGKRMADVRSLSRAKVAVIRRNDLKRFIKNNKELAIKLCYGIGVILSKRLIETTEKLSEALSVDEKINH